MSNQMFYFVLRNLDDSLDFKCNYPGKTSIGRGEQNHWTPPNSKAVSKEHAIVEIVGKPGEREFMASITDLESRNGTFFGHGNPIEWHKVRGVQKLNIGMISFHFLFYFFCNPFSSLALVCLFFLPTYMSMYIYIYI